MNDLLKKLHSKNITIDLIDDQLDIKAPKGAMTPELLSEIKEYKEALISFISEFNFERDTHILITKVSNKSSYALSSSQYRLWLLQQIESDNNAYNMPSAFSLKGVVNIQNLEKAFLKLIERHEILRTNILTEEETGIPKQIITSVEGNNFKLNHIDISKDKDVSKSLQIIIEKEVNYNFDLVSDALIRVSLIKKSKNDYILISIMHHIISDGWSSSIIITDLFSIYQSLTTRQETQLKPLSIQYKDFAEWQQSTLDSDSINEDKEYWLNQFKEEVPILEIPTYKLRPSVKTYNGKTIKKRFDKDVIKGFKKISKDQGVTLFMGLLSAVKILLYKYTNQTDIVIGSPFAGREHTELQNQIGFYVNTVGLRSLFKKEDNFINLLNQAKRTTLEAYAHQNYPFDELIKNLEIENDRSRNPLFDVVLSVDVQEENSDKFNITKDLIIDEIPLSDTTSKFDLEFAFKDNNLLLTYNTDIYTEDFIIQTTNHLQVILKSIIENPELTIGSVPYLTIKEKTTLIEEFNNTKIDYKYTDKTYIDLFEEQVKRTPKNIAIVFEEKKLTYKELDELSNQLAHYLIENYKVSFEDFIGVKLERSDWLIVSFIAILKTGGAYLPIDLEYPEERISFIESDSQCKVILNDSIISEFEKNKNQLKTLPSVKIKETNLAYVIYTSGSTGTPKGTLIEHKSLLNLCFWHINEYEVNEFSRGTLYSGIAFDASIWEISPYLLAGAALYPVLDQTTRLDFNKLTSFLKDNNITHSYLPTTITNELVTNNFKSEDITILTGGDTLKINKAPGFKLFNNYGPTENTVVTTSFNLQNSFDSSIPIGKPISNTSCYILDENLEPLPIGILGKLYVSGAGVARGYLNKLDVTAERFRSNPFVKGERMYDTGDLAKWLPNGNIEFLGRKDSQVKIRGYRIELEEIENTIVQFSDDIKHVVLSVKETENEKELVAYYVSKSEIDKSELRDFIQRRLPPYMVPSYYMALDTITLTPNGKIDKKALPEITSESLIQKEYVAPRNKTEQELVEIWQDVLGIEKIGITDNFFELGGHSLMMIQIVNRIKKQLSYTIDTKDFLTYRTIDKITQKLTEYINIEIPLSFNSNLYPLSEMQFGIWMLSQKLEGNKTYTIPFKHVLKGKIDIIHFSTAINILLNRHEILRTIFILKENKLFQKILEYNTVPFDISHYQNCSKDKIIEFEEHIFELDKFPLFKILVNDKNTTTDIYFKFHHIIVDEWSLHKIFFRQLMKLYNELKEGIKENLKVEQLQYKDYITHLNTDTHKELLKNEKKYWLNKLNGYKSRIDLDVSKPRKKHKTHRSRDFELELSKDFFSKINFYSQEKNIPVHSLLLSIMNLILYRYSNKNDLVIGIPVSGRSSFELENIMGLFINTIPVRTKINPNSKTVNYLNNHNKNLLEALNHQTLPISNIIEMLNIDRESNRSPLFDYILNIHYSDKVSVLTDQISITDDSNIYSNYDMVYSFFCDKKKIVLVITYNYQLFEKDMIKKMGENFQSLGVSLFENTNDTIESIVNQINYVKNQEMKSSTALLHKVKDILGIDVLDEKESLFNIGLTSIKAIELTNYIENIYEKSIDIIDLYQIQSFEGLIRFITGKDYNIEQTKDLENLFLIPPILGLGFVFSELIFLLNKDYDCSVIEYSKLTIEENDSFDDLVTKLTLKIIKKANGKSINILGYSYGGRLAFEIAKKLEKLNYQLSIILLDVPRYEDEIDIKFINEDLVNEELGRWEMLNQSFKVNELIDDVKIKIKILNNAKVKGKIKGSMLCLEGKDNFPNAKMNEWSNHVSGTFEHRIVKGDHYTILSEKNLFDIVLEIYSYLN